MRTLFPPYAPPPAGTVLDPDTTVVLRPPTTGPLPAYGPDVVLLGQVDLDHAGRSLADVLADIDRWAEHPVAGIFFDRAPGNPFSVGAVALALRVARRRGLHRLVLNPGAPTHPLYRDLGVAICTFEGPWLHYQRWSPEGTAPGDGHLVHDVPTAQLPLARHLLAWRGAGFGVATDAHRAVATAAAAGPPPGPAG